MRTDCFALSYAGHQKALNRTIPALQAEMLGISGHVCTAQFGQILTPEETAKRVNGNRVVVVELTGYNAHTLASELSAISTAAKNEVPCVLFIDTEALLQRGLFEELAILECVKLIVFDTKKVDDELRAGVGALLPNARTARFAPHNVRAIAADIKKLADGHPIAEPVSEQRELVPIPRSYASD